LKKLGVHHQWLPQSRRKKRSKTILNVYPRRIRLIKFAAKLLPSFLQKSVGDALHEPSRILIHTYICVPPFERQIIVTKSMLPSIEKL
jgi:hypothetical protein